MKQGGIYFFKLVIYQRVMQLYFYLFEVIISSINLSKFSILKTLIFQYIIKYYLDL